MNTYRSILVVASFLLVFQIFGADGFADNPRGVTDDVIKIAWIFDLTGPASYAGIPYLAGVRSYVRWINEQGGILGRKIKMIVEDDRYSIPGSLAAYKKVVYRDKVLTILGMGGSGQHRALYSQIEKDRIPVLGASWSNHVSRPFKRYSFQPTNDNIDEVKLMVDYMVNNTPGRKPRIAYAYIDLEVGKSGLDQLKKSLEHYGLTILGKEVVGVGDLDATSPVLALRRTKADFVVTFTGGNGIFSLLRDARKLGFHPAFISSLHLIGEETVRIAGEGARKLITVSTCGSWHDTGPEIVRMRKITLQYHPEPKYIEEKASHRYYIKGWLTTMILEEGCKNAGRDLDGETLITGLEKIRNLDMGGLSAPVSFGPKRRKATDMGKFYKADVEKKYFVPISEWMRPMH